MRFTNIAKTVELKKGFVRASAVFGKTMVLLFKIDKGVLLDNHNHPHIQLGYCFEGEFDLLRQMKQYQFMQEIHISCPQMFITPQLLQLITIQWIIR